MRAVPALAAAAAAFTLSAPAAAVDGALYEYGWASATASGIAAPTWTATRFGDEFDLAAAAGAASVGPKWWLTWSACGTPGVIAHSVRWSARRTDASTSARLQFQVARADGTVWGSANLRDALTGVNAPFEAPVGVGCSGTLAVQQIGAGTEPVRRYWVAAPRFVVRDVLPPTLDMTGPPGGWFNASADGTAVTWTAADNMGADGIGAQRVVLDGVPRWTGTPGQGAHLIGLSLAGLADGGHVVRVEVDGDGTPGVAAERVILVDRSSPVATGLSWSAPGEPGVASFRWTAGDPPGGSGLRSATVEVNTAPDGSAAGTWQDATTRTGISAASADLQLGGLVGDGVHAWRLRLEDVAGNRAFVVAPSPVVVDTTAPTVEVGAPPAGYVSALRLGVTAHDNLEHVLGLGALEVEGNTAPDGGASGAWMPLLDQPVRATPGAAVVDLPVRVLGDGTHRIRVRVRNGGPFGAALAAEQSVAVRVDATSPAFTEPVAFWEGAPGEVGVRWVAEDALAGVARAELQWNDGAAWRMLASGAAVNGVGRLAADAAALPDGPVALRLVVVDAAGNGAVATTSGLLDRTPPLLSGLALEGGPPWAVAFETTDAGGIGDCRPRVRVSGAGTGFTWREVATGRAAAGRQSVVLPLEGLPAGAYRVGVLACDAAGNTAEAETSGLLVGGDGAVAAPGLPASGTVGGASPTPGAALRGARLTARIVGGRFATGSLGREHVVRRRAGASVTVTGTLTTGAGTPMAGERIALRDAGGRVLGAAVTARDGSFRVSGRPLLGGEVRVGVPVDGALLPAGDVRLRVRLTPVVTVRASRRQAAALGAPVAITGRVMPAPAVSGARRKAVVLEWLDPRRGAWRPILASTATRGGAFRFTWAFRTPGVARFRVRVPAERRWPYEPAVSSPVDVRVR